MAKPKIPSLTQQIHNYDDTLLDCRGFRQHAWSLLGYFKEEEYIVQAARCSRCKTIREQWSDNQGYLMGNRYHYPKGYKVITKKGEPSKAILWRQEMQRRSKVYASRQSVLPEE